MKGIVLELVYEHRVCVCVCVCVFCVWIVGTCFVFDWCVLIFFKSPVGVGFQLSWGGGRGGVGPGALGGPGEGVGGFGDGRGVAGPLIPISPIDP